MLNNSPLDSQTTGEMEPRDARDPAPGFDVHRAAPLEIRESLALLEAFAVDRDQTVASAAARPKARRAPIDSDELARAIAEIEVASAALRQSEPTLEPWQPEADPHSEKRYLPVWVVIGGVWVVAMLSLSGGIGAILYLVG
jgi:hypothetical protein